MSVGVPQLAVGAPGAAVPSSFVHVRLATPQDAEALRLIYNYHVTTSTATTDLVARTVEEQRAWLHQRSGAHAVVLAEDGAVVVGFASLSPWRDRPGYRTTVEDSVYVDPDHQGRGFGRILLDEIVTVGRSHGFHAMMARVVDGHEASLRLHESLGFSVVGIERQVARKFNQWLDVVVMQLML